MKRFASMFLVLTVAAAAAYAVNRYLAMAGTEAALAERSADLREAEGLYQASPEAFAAAHRASADQPLKPLVQAVSNRNGIRLSYLSETEKELGKGIRERSVVARASEVPHAMLVAFLAQIEAQGGGARIKEIRLKPSQTQSGVYQDAECVVARNRYEERATAKEAR